MKLVLLLALVLVITSAQYLTAEESNFNVCVDPRPDICNEIYDPVVSTSGPTKGKIYGNRCLVCTDHKVIDFQPVFLCGMFNIYPKMMKEAEKASQKVDIADQKFCGITDDGKFVDLKSSEVDCEGLNIKYIFGKECPK